ncbi:hypothetical protein CHARACLAT_028638 [Characodon lateralis]|uniref:Uncharacterized protein n=1 Tax=Characodon lateralis TaxID=208331 RepID=A0ABU7EN26_9TELE|nr:hypothetical protein [Characodon lateralis]
MKTAVNGCRRSPGIWRLKRAAYLVISHGAIRRRTASTSAADCFAPCGLALCIVSLVLKNLWKVPRTVNLIGHLTLAGSLNGSEYRFSCEPCPPSSKDYLPGSCQHLTLDQHSVPTRSLPGGYRRSISKHICKLRFVSIIYYLPLFLPITVQPGFLVTRPSFQSLNKITKTFLVSECSLHVDHVGSQNYNRIVSPAGPSRGTP